MASKRVYVELRTYVNEFKRNYDLVLPINLPQFNIQLIFLSGTPFVIFGINIEIFQHHFYRRRFLPHKFI